MATVDFGGVTQGVCLAYVPDVEVGDYTIVHVGFAITKLDEESALETLQMFTDLGLLDELGGERRCRHGRSDVKYLDEFNDPALARALLDEIDARRHQAVGDHGGLRRPDALDHPQRHRPAAARQRRADPRARLPGVRHAAGDHRQGARDRRRART